MATRSVGTVAKPVPGQEVKQETDGTEQVGGEDDFIQSMPDKYTLDG